MSFSEIKINDEHRFVSPEPNIENQNSVYSDEVKIVGDSCEDILTENSDDDYSNITDEMDEYCGQSANCPRPPISTILPKNIKKNTNLKQHPRTSELKKPMTEITKIPKKELTNTEAAAEIQ